MSISAGSLFQHALADKGNQHILTKEIPNDTFKFNYNCGNSIKVFVLKKTHESAINYNVHSDLVTRYFDYLFTLLCSAPSIDQLGYSRCVCTGIAK